MTCLQCLATLGNQHLSTTPLMATARLLLPCSQSSHEEMKASDTRDLSRLAREHHAGLRAAQVAELTKESLLSVFQFLNNREIHF